MPVVVSCFAIIAALAVYFFVIPFVSGIKLLADEIQKKMIDQQEDQSRISKLPQMEDDWAYFESNQESTDVILNPANQLEFIESIETIANKTGNAISLQIEESPDPREIEKMKKESAKNKDGIPSILGNISSNSYFPVQINLKGDYNGLVNFINMLENGRIYANIVSVDIRKGIIEDTEDVKSKNIFSSDSAKEENLNKKEILNSAIRAVVYTKN